jgi:uncharacterized membrane protein
MPTTRSKKDSVNIYVNGDEKDTMSATNIHENYIIQMNNSLNEENKILRMDNKESQHKIDELEEEIERMEKSKTYMKGLLKNFVEIDTHRKTIIKNYKHIISQKNQYENNISSVSKRYMMAIQLAITVLVILNFLMMGFSLNSILLAISLGMYSYSNFTFVKKTFISPKFTQEFSIIKNSTTDINETIKAIDYLHEYIDCL